MFVWHRIINLFFLIKLMGVLPILHVIYLNLWLFLVFIYYMLLFLTEWLNKYIMVLLYHYLKKYD